MKFLFCLKASIIQSLFLMVISCEDTASLNKEAALDQQMDRLTKEITALKAIAGKNPGDQNQHLSNLKKTFGEALSTKNNLEDQNEILKLNYEKIELEYYGYKKSYPARK